jgi:hypothetical protein
MTPSEKNDEKKFLELVEKYNLPQPITNIDGKTVDYVIDDWDTHIIVFTDNTCYYFWTNDSKGGIDVEESYRDIYVDHFSLPLGLLKDKFPEAKREWDQYKEQLRKQNDELKREYRYNEYLKLKAEFEGGK